MLLSLLLLHGLSMYFSRGKQSPPTELNTLHSFLGWLLTVMIAVWAALVVLSRWNDQCSRAHKFPRKPSTPSLTEKISGEKRGAPYSWAVNAASVPDQRGLSSFRVPFSNEELGKNTDGAVRGLAPFDPAGVPSQPDNPRHEILMVLDALEKMIAVLGISAFLLGGRMRIEKLVRPESFRQTTRYLTQPGYQPLWRHGQ